MSLITRYGGALGALAAGVIMATGSAQAEIRLVPEDYATIQAAIDACLDGDVVELADGIYTGAGNKNLDFGGKAITVRSAWGDPEACVIDCEGEGRGFYFHSGEGTDSIVEALTITNGFVDWDSPGHSYGGGVYCGLNSSPMIGNCRIRGNSSEWAGGGICSDDYSAPWIIDCTISGNTAMTGGGIHSWGSDGVYIGCTIKDNLLIDDGGTYYSGGGIYVGQGDPSFTDCTISDNSAMLGAGIYCESDGNATLDECVISGNIGVGVGCGTSDPALIDCTISENTAMGIYCNGSSEPSLNNCWISNNFGPGIYASGSNPALTNCVISGNTYNGPWYSTGGVYCIDNSSPRFTNCTIVGNTANNPDEVGCSVHCTDNSAPTLTNCIIRNDTPQEIYVESSTVAATYCNVKGGWAGEGNIDVDPQFAFAGDFHLTPGSPCIDAGANEPTGGAPDEDFEGGVRILDGDGDSEATADMGAYEFNPAGPAIALSTTEFEFATGQGGGNPPAQTLQLLNSGGGTLYWEITGQPAWLSVWPSSGASSGETNEATLSVNAAGLTERETIAVLEITDSSAVNSPRRLVVRVYKNTRLAVPGEYVDIKSAINAAHPGDVVEIADGTYTEGVTAQLSFHGKAITVRSASGRPESCIIDCANFGCGVRFSAGEGPDTVLEGVTITNGSSLYDIDRIGGGVICYWSNPTLKNCVISSCEAGDFGGGVYCYGSAPTLIGCVITDNVATSEDGGGVYSEDSSPAFIDCAINGNRAERGGGVYCNDSSVTFIDCTIGGNFSNNPGGGLHCADSSYARLVNCNISGNSSDGRGGGLLLREGSNAEVVNCVISSNYSHARGGGISCSDSSPVFVNCTMSGNSAYQTGGALACWAEAYPTFTNCTLWGDTPDEAWVFSTGAPVFSYSNVENGAGEAWFGAGCIDVDPAFVDPDGADDDPETWEDNDYRLAPRSPCIDAGNNLAVPADVLDLDEDGDRDEATPYDLDWNARFADDLTMPDSGVGEAPVVDMGAYEFIPGDLDRDGSVGLGDLAALLGRYGACEGDAGYHVTADFDANGCIELSDLAYLLGYYGGRS